MESIYYIKELIENRIPPIWKDKEIRHLSSEFFDPIYELIQKMKTTYNEIFICPLSKNTIVYTGQFGSLILKRVNDD